MRQKHQETRYGYLLPALLLGILLAVQPCPAYNLHLDPSVSSSSVFIGTPVTSSFHVYDSEHPGVPITGAYVLITATHIPAIPVADVALTTNASGWAVFTYTPTETGRYSITSQVSVNYSKIAGLPPVGVQKVYGTNLWFNATSKSALPLKTIEPFVIITFTPTVQPVTSAVTVPPVTSPVTAPTTAPTTAPVTQVTPSPPATVTVPASQTDTIPPVTMLTLAGTQDGSGGYNSDVTCTLAASDNPGGSGVSQTQYSFDGTGWYTYSQPVSIVKAGTTTFYYRSVDNAGNTEVAKVKAIVISSPGAAPAGSIVPGTGAAGTPPAAPTALSGFPLPLWLTALIILILVAAMGGALYLKSRQKEEPKQ